jgi:secreted Zn-dependent insulinase-like peptidase
LLRSKLTSLTSFSVRYASHLLGHEGAGSLLSALKARGWAAGVCAGVAEGGHERSSASWLFTVGVTLTDAGRNAWRDVAALVFQYTALCRAAPPQAWIFEELAAIKVSLSILVSKPGQQY